MLDPYRMVFVNVIASFLLILGILVYKFIYPKKKINLLVLLTLISLLPLISLLRKGTYESGLLSEHVSTAISFYQSLQEGNFLPSWSEKACSGYGCPLFIFHYRLPFYLSSFFHLIGFSFLASIKMLLATSFIASGIAMYLWIKDELGKIAGFVSAVFYLFAPYHLADMHFRVSIGEVLSFVFLPLIMLSIKKLSKQYTSAYFVIGAISTASIILSHHITLYASLPIIIIYSLTVLDKKKFLRRASLIATMLGTGVLLAAHFWIPIIFENKFMRQGLVQDINFSPLWTYLYSPFEYRFGLLFQGHYGELYPNIGYAHILVLFLGAYILWKSTIKGTMKILLISYFGLFLFYFFMTQSISLFLWEIIPFIKNAGFAWRLMIEVSLITAVIAGIVVKQFNKNSLALILCFLAIFLTILNGGNRKTIPERDDTFFKTAPIYEEAPCRVELTTPLTVDICAPWISKYPRDHLEILSGNGIIKQIDRSSRNHEYIVYAEDTAVLKENTYYFPGWELHVNNKPHSVDYDHKMYKGLMVFTLQGGLHDVRFSFVDTPVRKYSKWLSFGTLIVLLSVITLLSMKKIPKKSIPSQSHA